MKVLYKYSELNEEAKAKARNEIIQEAYGAVWATILNIRKLAKTNIHRIVNGYCNGSLVFQKRLLFKFTNDKNYLEEFIKDNLSYFLENGEYFRFMSNKEEIQYLSNPRQY